MSTGSAKRPRRTTEEVRQRLLDAAEELFLADGYDATSTRRIAKTAGVAEKVLFGNFASKAGIFDAVFVEPFARLADRYIADWEDVNSATVEARVASFVSKLYDLAYRNRSVLRAALARQGGNGHDAHSEIVQHLARAIGSLMRIEDQHLPGVDQQAAVIATSGMIFGVVLLDDLLIPAGRRRPSRRRLEAEITGLILGGVLHREPTS